MATPLTPPPQHPIREAVRLGITGVKANLRPGAVLWLAGLILIISYHQFAAVSNFFDHIGRWKEGSDPWFSMLSTALFGSVIPWVVQARLLPADKRQPLRQVPWLFLFWGLHGWMVNGLYQMQSRVFGDGSDWVTIVQKTFVDQFLWSPFCAMPQVLFGYLFIENELSHKRFRAALDRKGFLARAIPLVLANWVVWIPTVALIYLFPLPLQLPLQNIILALWCLLLIFFARES